MQVLVLYSVQDNLYKKKPAQESMTHIQETRASRPEFLVHVSSACLTLLVKL